MSVKETVGNEGYERVREVLQKAFPGGEVTDAIVDGAIRAAWRVRLEALKALGVPVPSPEEATAAEPSAEELAALASAPSYPLYLGNAQHQRVLAMNSNEPFHSEFVGTLPLVRVRLPQSLHLGDERVSTAIGEVDLKRDHLVGSIALVTQKYGGQLGYRPARVDLITPARLWGVRFAAVALYLGYKEASDATPSFYLLEAGMATGQAAMLYLGQAIDSVIVARSGYLPTPFASPNNTYTGWVTMDGDEPVQLVVQANEPSRSFYIQVTVKYEKVSTPDREWPADLTWEAMERVCAIGDAMKVPTGIPLQEVLGALGLKRQWMEVPGFG
ncbi:hypothetical protein [Chondromyces apiculatus]|uniref:Uncharacterized protein n=1 Tax=Chondromyces apiculatus DSM 436 TaxID=1192034 RepID=A0A017TD61_9BACT|nr:hypothetical protein [Chondromyces apiculatus]EYF07169.1 Hypothetical protein CAP_0648 [Chondromyces apiculatus DSM 436]